MSENTTTLNTLRRVGMRVDNGFYIWTVRYCNDPWGTEGPTAVPVSLRPYILDGILQTDVLRKEMESHGLPLIVARRIDPDPSDPNTPVRYQTVEYEFGEPETDRLLDLLRSRIAAQAAADLTEKIAELERQLIAKKDDLARVTAAIDE